jgi:hypothetical protein
MDPLFESFMQEIAAFLAESGMAETTFGARSVNDGKLLDRLRANGNVTTRTMRRVEQFIATQRAAKAAAQRAGKAVA